MPVNGSSVHRSNGRLLARNTILNLIGYGAPLPAALIAIPFLVSRLGMDRFGLLTLAWVMIGYFSLFDLGLGRALTKLIAEKLAEERDTEIPALAWTTLFLMLLLGVTGSSLLALLSPWLIQEVLRIPEHLRSETLYATYLLIFSIPLVISTAALRGILEAKQCFGLINAVRIPLGVFTFIGPLLVLPFSQSLVAVVGVLAVGRLVAWAIHLAMCLRVVPALAQGMVIQQSIIPPLFRLGGWMTVTNVVGPLMTYLDRFLIGALMTVTAVAYYATPYEIVTKFWLIPMALTGVLFPIFAANVRRNEGRVAQVYNGGLKFILLTLYPITLLVVTLAYEGIDLWLGATFAENSAYLMQILAIGVFLNCLAQIPFALIQGAGHADVTAKLHLLELPVYLIGVYWMIKLHGIEGAALAWTVRAGVDAALLFFLARKFLPKHEFLVPRTTVALSMCAAGLGLGFTLEGLGVKVFFLTAVIISFMLVAWFVFLTPAEKTFVCNPLRLVDEV